MLTDKETELIEQKLGHKMTPLENALFDAMWSEHISYKSSRKWFSYFNTEGDNVYLGIGEGAGLIEIGEGWLVGLGLESHNHPSAIDPFNGAATGIGGIIRDIISQGCHPIALLDSLHFGNPQTKHTQHLIEGVVRGISSYGNCVGIPTIGGEIEFHENFETNCLVNAMCVGIVHKDRVVRSRAQKADQLLILFGATTGRDGIGGVSFASEDLSSKSYEDRPAVQIGNPLIEKILIDAIKDLIDENLIAGLQDLGGGGLTCASSEMVTQVNLGVEIYLDNIPLREQGMKPWEIMISESQERMLAIVDENKMDKVIHILESHELEPRLVGKVINENEFKIISQERIIANIPVSFLVKGVPMIERSFTKPEEIPEETFPVIADNEELKTIALKILELPSNASKQWIYQQYDQTVQANTINQAGLNAAVIRIPQLQNKGIAISIDTNSSFCFLDPRSGSANSAAECLRNIVSTGATPIGLVDCLNFGNPEKPDSYWQFVEAVQGLGQFTHDFKIPVVGGNVSLYNETIDRDGKRLKINPTPVIGIVGEIEKLDHTLKNIIIQPNSSIYIIGNTNVDLCGTEVQKHFFNKLFGNPPDYNANAERKSMNTILQLHKENLILSCNDISQGGLFISIVEMILPSNYGVTLNLNNLPGDSTQLLEKLFSETGARYLIEIDSNRDIEVQTILQANNVVHGKIGEVSSMHTNLIIDEIIFEKLELLRRWEEGLTKYMI